MKYFLIIAFTLIFGILAGYIARDSYLPTSPIYRWSDASLYDEISSEITVEDLRTVNADLKRFISDLKTEELDLLEGWAIVYVDDNDRYNVCVYVSPLSSTDPIEIRDLVNQYVQQRLYELIEQRRREIN